MPPLVSNKNSCLDVSFPITIERPQSRDGFPDRTETTVIPKAGGNSSHPVSFTPVTFSTFSLHLSSTQLPRIRAVHPRLSLHTRSRILTVFIFPRLSHPWKEIPADSAFLPLGIWWSTRFPDLSSERFAFTASNNHVWTTLRPLYSFWLYCQRSGWGQCRAEWRSQDEGNRQGMLISCPCHIRRAILLSSGMRCGWLSMFMSLFRDLHLKLLHPASTHDIRCCVYFTGIEQYRNSC